MSVPDVQTAFRAGLKGHGFRAAPPPPDGLAEAPAPGWPSGPNESLVEQLDRLPGLSEPRAAYATGRAVRRVMRLFDQAGAPEGVGRQFLDNLRAATAVQAMRDRRVVWGGGDTVAMFMEMYARILGEGGADFAKVEAALLADALSDPAEPGGRGRRGGALLAALRRRATGGGGGA